MVREEKDALAEALERLRAAGTGSTSGTRGLREAVHRLEEQLLRERAKSQRSASKRGQEQRHLMEQASLCNLMFALASDRIECYSVRMLGGAVLFSVNYRFIIDMKRYSKASIHETYPDSRNKNRTF